MCVNPAEFLEELLEFRDRDVLDVGCGEGWLVRRLAAGGARVVGIDPLASALDRAREHDPGAPAGRYVEGGAQTLPFEDSSFDVVVMFNSLHHVPAESMASALDESARVLRPGGVLCVQEPLAEGPFFELMRPIDDETPVRAAAQEALRQAATHGFKELASRDGVIATELAGFDEFRARMVSVHPGRAAAFDELEEALREAFVRLGRRSGGGYVFDQPFRVALLAP